MAEEDRYTTTDFYITAMLIAKDFEVRRISKEGPDDRVKRFHFEDDQELQDTILAYMNGSLEGNLKGFKQAIETVKDMVHSG